MSQLAPLRTATPLSSLIAAAVRAFREFIASSIRNPHRRLAFGRALHEFLSWCEQHGVALIAEVKRLHVVSAAVWGVLCENSLVAAVIPGALRKAIHAQRAA